MPHTALLISVRPRFADQIFAGTKSVELRRLRPRIDKGDMVLVYVSAPVMALVGAFEVNEVASGTPNSIWRRFNGGSGLSRAEFDQYYRGKQKAFAILIGRRWRLPSPVTLATLRKHKNGFHPPQSFHYMSRSTFPRITRIANELRQR